MSVAKELRQLSGNGRFHVFAIGDQNPCLGQRVRVTWLRPWGGRPIGFIAEGELLATFCVNGRTLIGELKVPKLVGDGWKKVSCPWSRRFLAVEVL